jgi:hypothetical protein
LLTELDLNKWIEQDNHDKLNQLFLNNKILQSLNLSYRKINLFLPSLCSIFSLTSLNLNESDIVDHDFYQICSSLKNIKIIKFHKCPKLTPSNIISSLKLLSSTLSYFNIDTHEYSVEQLVDLFSTCTYLTHINIVHAKLNIHHLSNIVLNSSLMLTHVHIEMEVNFIDILNMLLKYSSLTYFSFQCSFSCSSMFEVDTDPTSDQIHFYTYPSFQSITQFKQKLKKKILKYQNLSI